MGPFRAVKKNMEGTSDEVLDKHKKKLFITLRREGVNIGKKIGNFIYPRGYNSTVIEEFDIRTEVFSVELQKVWRP